MHELTESSADRQPRWMADSLPHKFDVSWHPTSSDANSVARISQRIVNARHVLSVAWQGEPLTASQLMAATGLTRATVLSVCRDLASAGWIEEVEDSRSAGQYAKGRPALRYAFRPNAAFVVACDADEDVFTVSVSDLHGVEQSRTQRAVDAHDVTLDRRRTLTHLVDEALEQAGVSSEQVSAAVIGVPAPVDAAGESPDDAPVNWWTRMNPHFVDLFEHRGWQMGVDNDANLAARCEAAAGAGRGIRSFATLLSAERFGTGVVVDGQLLRGTQGGVGEMHILEMVSGVEKPAGLAFHARQEVERRAAAGSLTGELARMELTSIRAEQVFSLAKGGDSTAVEIVQTLAERLAPVVMLLSGLLDLDRVIVAGSVASALAPVLERTREIMNRSPKFTWAELVASEHGGDVVLRGAVASAIALVRESALLDADTLS